VLVPIHHNWPAVRPRRRKKKFPKEEEIEEDKEDEKEEKGRERFINLILILRRAR
jgi:hypothetical protein